MARVLSQTPTSSRRVLVASTNPVKRERLRTLVEGLASEIRSVEELPSVAAPVEIGDSHREIAVEKARYWSLAFGGAAIASDGGVSIPALGDTWDSLTTQRAAGAGVSDAERTRHLLALMSGLTGEQRAARRLEAVALADRGETIGVWEGEGEEGLMLPEPREPRVEGAWIGSLLYYPNVGMALTEMSAEGRRLVADPWGAIRELMRTEFRREGSAAGRWLTQTT